MIDKNKIQIVEILNPLEPSQATARFEDYQGKTLQDFFPLIGMTEQVALSMNGALVADDKRHEFTPQAGDVIVVCPVLAGGGGGGKTILRLGAMIALGAMTGGAGFASFTGNFGIQAGLGLSIAQGVVMMAGSMLINALLPAPKASSSSTSSSDSPTTYGYDGPKNVSAEGLPVPVIYGTHRYGGNLINAYTVNDGDTQFLHLLFNCGEGPISGITDVWLDDTPIENFTDYQVETRLGEQHQGVIPWFTGQTIPRSVAKTLTTAWTVSQTEGKADRLRLDFVLSSGLYGVNTKTGDYGSIGVTLQVQYRVKGSGADWQPLGSSSSITGYAEKVTWQSFDTTRRVDYGDGGYQDVADTFVWYEGNGERRVGDEYFGPVGSEYENVVVGRVSKVAAMTSDLVISANQRTALRRSFFTDNLPEAVYEVRVRRTREAGKDGAGNPPANAEWVDGITWSELNEIQNEVIQYPNTALLGIRIKLGDQLNGLPAVTHLNHGRKIRCWDAVNNVWVDKHSPNPAWITLDAQTNKRYGAGISTSRFDLEKWKVWAQHCDDNGLEYNGIFDTQSNIWDAMTPVYRAGHAGRTNVGTRFSVAIERAEAPRMMFTVGNMISGTFKQTWLPATDRANELEISYIDRDDAYKQKTMRVVDTLVQNRAPKSATVDFTGLTSVDQVWRDANILLNQNRLLLQTVEWSSPLEAIACQPGDVVMVQHDMPAWSKGGRAEVGSDALTVKLDRPITMSPGMLYSLLVHFGALGRHSAPIAFIAGNAVYIDGYTGATNVKRARVNGRDIAIENVVQLGNSYGVALANVDGLAAGMNIELWDTDAIESRVVINESVTADTPFTEVKLTAPFPDVVPAYAQWMFGQLDRTGKLFRIKSITGNTDYRRDIVAIEYNADAYQASPAPATPNYSELSMAVKQAVIDSVDEEPFTSGNAIKSRVSVLFHGVDDSFFTAAVYLSRNGGAEEKLGEDARKVTVEAAIGDTLTLRVVARDAFQRSAPRSSAPTITVTAQGRTVLPGDATGITVALDGDAWLATWDAPTDPAISATELRIDGANWDTATKLFRGNATSARFPLQAAGDHVLRVRHCIGQTDGLYSGQDALKALKVLAPAQPIVRGENGYQQVSLQYDDCQTTQPLSHYMVKKGKTEAAAVVVAAQVFATTFTFSEPEPGSNTYWVAAFDKAGNASAWGYKTLEVLGAGIKSGDVFPPDPKNDDAFYKGGNLYFYSTAQGRWVPSGIIRVDALPAAGDPAWRDGDSIRLSSDGRMYTLSGGVWKTPQALIADESLDMTKFASGLQPVVVVDTLPAAYKGSVIYVGSTQKLYRWDGQKYTASIEVVDLVGQIQPEQLASGVIDSTKLAAGLSAVVTSNGVPTVFVGQTVYDSVSKKLLRWAGNGYTSAVDTVDLVGTIKADQLATGVIDNTKLAANLNAVVTAGSMPGTAYLGSPSVYFGGKLYTWHDGTGYSAAVETVDLVGTISTAQLAKGAVDATKVAAGLDLVVSSAGVPPNYIGAVVYNTATGKLLRWVNGVYTANIDTDDLLGTISAEHLTSQALTQTLAASNLGLIVNVAGTPNNYVGDVVYNTVTRTLLRWDGSSYSGKVAVTDLTGQIKAEQLAAGTVDGTKLASGLSAVVSAASQPGGTYLGSPSVYYGNKLYTWKDGVGYSTAVATTDLDGQVQAVQIATGVIDNSKMAAGLTAIVQANSQPGTAYLGSTTVWFNGQTYSWDNGKYSRAVATVDLVGQIKGEQLAAGSVGVTQFAHNLAPVMILDYIPGYTYLGSTLVYSNADGQTYRWDGSHYTLNVAAANVSGLLTDAQLGAISASKVAGEIVSTQIKDGSITTPKMVAGAVSADILAAGAVTAGKMAIGDFENLVTNNQGYSLEGWDIRNAPAFEATRGWGTPWWSNLGSGTDGAFTQRARDQFFGPAIPVKLGDQFYVSFLSVPEGGRNCPWDFVVGFAGYNSNGQVTQWGGISNRQAATTGPAFTEGAGTVVVPGTAYIRVWTSIQNTAPTDFVGKGMHFTDIQFRRKNTGNLIVDGAITANLVHADAIEAGKIAAGAVNTRELAAGAITAEKLSVSAISGENLVLNGSFEDGLVGWKNKHSSSSNPNWGTPTASWAQDGSRVLNSYRSNPGDCGCLVSRAFPVLAGETYVIRVKLKSYANQVCAILYAGYSVDQPADGYNGDEVSAQGGWIGLPDAYQMPAPGGSWEIYERVFTVPVNFRWMSVAIHNWTNVWSGPAELYVDEVSVKRRVTSAVIADGAITTPKLVTDAVKAGKIDANAISARELQVNSVRAGHIFTDAVTAGTIAAGAVQASALQIGVGMMRRVTLIGTGAGMDTASEGLWFDGNRVNSGLARGLNLVVYTRNSHELVWAENFDTYGSPGRAQDLASRLAVYDTHYVVFVWSFDANHVPQNDFLVSQLKRCGASTVVEKLNYRQSYALIGYPGMGEGNGLEAMNESSENGGAPANITTLWLDGDFVGMKGSVSAFSNFGSTMIADGAIVTGKLAVGSVSAEKIAVNSINADAIQAGAVKVGKIDADAVTAGTVAAAAINTRELAAGAITAEKLKVASYSQALNSDPSFLDATAWTSNQWKGNFLTPSDSPSGQGVLDSNGGPARGESNRFPLDGNKTYKFSAWYRSFGGVNGLGYLRVHRIGANGELGSNSAFEGIGGANDGIWRKHEWVFKAEPGSNFGFIDYHANWGGNTGSWQYADLRCEEQIGNTLIADGSITTQKIVADAVKAGQIDANAISARELQVNSVKAGKIDTDAVQAGNIEAGAISAREIRAGAITSDKLAIVSTGSNLLFNGGWEEGMLSWSPGDSNVPGQVYAQNASVSGSNQGSYEGQNVCRLSRVQPSDAAQVVSRAIPVIPGEQYRIRGAYRSLNGRTIGFHMAVGLTKTPPTGGFITAGIATGSGGIWTGLAFNAVAINNVLWNIYETVYTIPAGMYWFSLCPHNWTFPQPNGWEGDNHLDLDDWSVSRVVTSALIADGAITTPKIVAGAVKADQIEAGAVKAGKLDVDAVTAGTVAVNAISAREIQAGAITAEKLNISNQEPSLVANPSFEDGMVGWSMDAYAANNAPWSIADGGSDGTKCFWIGRTDPAHKACVVSKAMAITPGAMYVLRFKFFVNSGGPRANMLPYIFQHQSLPASGFIPYPGAAYVDMLPGGGIVSPLGHWQTFEQTFQARGDCTWLSIAIHNWEGIWEGPVYLHLDEFSLRKQITSAFIADGAVTTDKLVALAVKAGKVDANAINAAAIQAGAIRAGHIFTDAVEAGTVAANAINTRELAAGAITAEKLAVTAMSGENLVFNGSFEEGTAGWTTKHNQNRGGAFMTFATSNARDGNRFASIYRYTDADGVCIVSRAFPVEPGATYVLRFMAERYSGNPRLIPGAGFSVMQPADGYNGYPDSANWMTFADVSVNYYGWNPYEYVFTVPENMHWMSVFFHHWSGSSLGWSGTAELYFDAVTVKRRITSAVIADGAITTDKLMALAVKAGKVDANAISADQIQANAVKVGKIDTDAVTAGTVAANAINTRALQAGSITASKMAIGDFENLVTNGKGESTDGWSGSAITAEANVGGWQDSWWGPLGEGSSSVLTISQRDSYYGPDFPCKAGDEFYAKFLSVTKGGGPGACNQNLGLALLDGAHNVVDWFAIASRPAGVAGGYKAEGSRKVVATNVSFARVWFQVDSDPALSGNNGYGVHTTNLEIRRKNKGELIVDGAITASKINVDAIEAQHIHANSVDFDDIKANAIRAGHIYTDAVQAGAIQAGAVNAREIAAGAITADKLAVVSFGAALNGDPFFMDATAWTKDPNWPLGEFIKGGDAPSGTGLLHAVSASRGVSNRFPLDVNKTYKFSAWYRSFGGAAGAGFLRVHRGGPSNGEIGYYSAFESVGPANDGVWRKHEWVFQPEPGTNFGWIDYHANWVASGGAWQYADIRVEEQIGSTLIRDGSITTEKIVANAVKAGQVDAGAIGADQIRAGAIVAGKLDANSVAAVNIQGGTITGDKIAGTTITGGHIIGGSITADKLRVDRIDALSSNLGHIYGVGLEIAHDGNDGAATGYIKSYGKNFGDGNTGFYFGRNGSNGAAYGEIRNYNSRLLMDGGNGYFELSGPGFSLTNSGLTINQANVIGELQIAGQSVTVPFIANIDPGTGTNYHIPGNGTYAVLVLMQANVGYLTGGGDGNMDWVGTSTSLFVDDQNATGISGYGTLMSMAVMTLGAGDHNVSVRGSSGALVTLIALKR